MPSISCIVARSYPGNVIGAENKLPWHLRTDLRKFRETTLDHVVIMGRRTFESIGRPLPGRTNIILSREPGNDGPDLYWVKDRENALFIADVMTIMRGKTHFFVIGGSAIYNTFDELINRVHLTEVYAQNLKGDAHFHKEFDLRKWKTISENPFPRSDIDDYPFMITILEKRNKTVRQFPPSYFLTGGGGQIANSIRERVVENAVILQPAIQLEFGMSHAD
ncbi:dihydrofolate reductase [Phreatobacter sp.]|uniref:dihydrofolate reductase n=1 Tax=Phreatobacter sp. TaxID=1966341 RepID=UPI003F72A497